MNESARTDVTTPGGAACAVPAFPCDPFRAPPLHPANRSHVANHALLAPPRQQSYPSPTRATGVCTFGREPAAGAERPLAGALLHPQASELVSLYEKWSEPPCKPGAPGG